MDQSELASAFDALVSLLEALSEMMRVYNIVTCVLIAGYFTSGPKDKTSSPNGERFSGFSRLPGARKGSSLIKLSSNY